MKYTFADGRNRLYQWDQNVVLNLPEIADGTEVHFAMSPAVALKRVVENGQVTIPDILLQKNRNIIIFVYLNDVTTDEGEIEVIGRPRPPEYIYTDPEKPTGEDIVDSLTSTATDKALSANQGRILDEKIGKKLDATGVTENSFLVGAGEAEMAEKTPEEVLSLINAAPKAHGNHVPTTEAANNARFLRNDNTWQEVTPANIGAAPAGLSRGTFTYTTDEELDAYLMERIKDTSFKNQSINHFLVYPNATGTTLTNGFTWFIEMCKSSSNYGCLTFKSYLGSGVRVARRQWNTNGLRDLEWESPPMVAGVEYRTTKRFNGKAVYTKLIDCGAAADAKSVTYNVTKTRLLDIEVTIGTYPARQKTAGEDATTSSYYATYYVTGASVTLYCGSSMVGQQSYAQIWYIKD